MCHGMIAPKSSPGVPLALTSHGLFLPLVIFSTFILESQASGKQNFYTAFLFYTTFLCAGRGREKSCVHTRTL